MLSEIVPKGVIKLIKKLINASNKDGIERTFTVCKYNDKYLIECGAKGKTNEVVVDMCKCGEPYLIFHTHTIDESYMDNITTIMSDWSVKNSTHLSTTDIISAINMNTAYSCVGSKHGISLYKINKHINTSMLELLHDKKEIEKFFEVILKDDIVSEICHKEISSL